ncbi:MAG TPA: aldo/keto reductase [Acidimicrobiales bacterium]|nr:aldo/keto reductase [Acidimicrobiales bacterium]
MDEIQRERPLGASGIVVPAVGVGTNRWGGRASDPVRLGEAYRTALDAGIGFFDTAEIYTGGRSERAVGTEARADARPVVLASKFAPYPHRLSAAQFSRALDRTLGRMGRESIDLYYLHFPYSPVGVGGWMMAMARAVQAGKIRAVGVSNCSAAQMRRAAAVLGEHDIPLAANQVQYSLTHRKPETDGVLDACRQMDVALVAYRPIGGGSLRAGGSTGSGPTPLMAALDEVATRCDATVTQVALAWLLRRDAHVIAIPGATKPAHVSENAGALSLTLSDDDCSAIDTASGGRSAR